MIVYLIGFMGSGKSTTGKKLASALNWNLIDLDMEIERRTGQLVHDIFVEHGEGHFRKVESDVLRSLLFDEDIIISCGGGTPCFNSNMEFMLNNGLTVYLKMDAEQLRSRLVNSHTVRPLLKNLNKDELLVFIQNSLAERESCYDKSEVVIQGLDVDIVSLKNKILKQNNPQV